MNMLLTFADKRKSIFKGISLTLIIFQFLSAAVFAQEVPVRLEPVMGEAADLPTMKKPAGGGVAALAELLKAKNVISAEEASVFMEQTDGSDQGVAALVALLKRKNVISAEEAAEFIAQNQDRKPAEKSAIISSETNVNERIEELNQSVAHVSQKVAELYSGKVAELAAAAPEWTKRVRFGGDIRLRTENDRFDKDNTLAAQPSNPTQLINTQVDSMRAKYRVRAGVSVDINDQVEAVARVSTGNASNPLTTNSTLGDFMNRDYVLFDLAYLRWHPSHLLNVYGGRMPNPWFSTDLVWAKDLNFEGMAVNLKTPLTESLTSFLTVGAFPLQQYDFSKRGKWLFGGQIGLENKNRSGVAYKMGAALYDFYNITGIANDPAYPGATDWTAPLYQQKGNTLFNISADPSVYKMAYASEFRELSLTGSLDIGFWDPVHVVLTGDYVKNRGFDKADVAIRTGLANPPKKTTGYKVGLTVGYPEIKEFGQWDASLFYKYIESDAVVDAFTDQDFHLGGTNARGWILGTNVGLLKDVWLGARWLSSNEISGPPWIIDVLQVDLNVRF